jgi:hypothetical protein
MCHAKAFGGDGVAATVRDRPMDLRTGLDWDWARALHGRSAMSKRRMRPLTTTLQRILASTLALTAGGGGVAGIACTQAADQPGGALTDAPSSDALPGDAPPADALPGDALPGDALPGDALPGDAPPADALLDASMVVTGDGSNGAPTCDVGYLSCCFEACSCVVPPDAPTDAAHEACGRRPRGFAPGRVFGKSATEW